MEIDTPSFRDIFQKSAQQQELHACRLENVRLTQELNATKHALRSAIQVGAAADKIKYWWSEDRQWFCMIVNDGVNQATISLSIEEAESLMDQVMQTPKYLAFQKECQDHALQLLAEARDR